LERIDEVRRVLRRKGYSQHAIEVAVTAVYRAAMPYILGMRFCPIANRRAWVFKVAKRAAKRATRREVHAHTLEPATLAATVTIPRSGDVQFDISEALKQLTEKQRAVIDRCILRDMPLRAAAEEMGSSVGTLRGHLQAAKARLREILPRLLRKRAFDPCACAS
jgi:RNA polymerase sigma factor (sigma-70 family)